MNTVYILIRQHMDGYSIVHQTAYSQYSIAISKKEEMNKELDSIYAWEVREITIEC